MNKIFNAFFTTKPTGQAKGLGLSLSYDIVKASAGKINAKTKENHGLNGGESGTEFVITLPF